MKYLFTLFLTLTSLLCPAQQKKTIDDLTIYVSEDVQPIIVFGSRVSEARPCNDRDYEIPVSEKNITIKKAEGVKKPASPCSLLVEDMKYQYLLNIVFVNKGSIDPIYDLTNESKIKELIARQKKGTKSKEPAKTENSTAESSSADEANDSAEEEVQSNDKLPEEAIPDFEIEKLQAAVENLIQKFYERLQVMCERKSYPIRDEIMEQGFNNCPDGCDVEVLNNSPNGPVATSMPLKDYLNRQMRVKVKVAIGAKHIQKVAAPKKGEDGKWYSTVTVLQYYEKSVGDKRTYSDITIKTFTITVVPFEVEKGGETVLKWKVFLNDIKADELKN